ncbi:MAG: hypothetical protein JW783_03945 [Bacteroidales bacterium]|nr:hypothetical protein [Bacteroidales bacterium]MBN2748554.1 hypothetical protein [Bacteroidales bacterium]
MKKIDRILTLAIVLLSFFSSCNISSKKEQDTPQSKAEQSITLWMESSIDEHPKYKPLGFSEVTPRYERTDRTLQLTNLIEEERAKNESSPKLDSLKSLLENNKGLLLGYTILHRYSTTGIDGEVTIKEDLFFLDSTFRVATILNPDAFDQILNEKLLFRPDSMD